MKNESFFRTDGSNYYPNPVCAGPWDPKSLHGRVIAGLLSYEIESNHGDLDFHPARLTVDLYRQPNFSPIQVASQKIRDGRRIRVVDAELTSEGKSIGRATCQLLKCPRNPEDSIWQRPNWSVPSPQEIESESLNPLGGMWEIRHIKNRNDSSQQRCLWMREVRQLIEGQELTPWQRVALAADFASPFANSGEKGLAFINTDITLYTHRPPTTPWIGFEVMNHQSDKGIAIAECYLYDELGPIGSSSVTALAQTKA